MYSVDAEVFRPPAWRNLSDASVEVRRKFTLRTAVGLRIAPTLQRSFKDSASQPQGCFVPKQVECAGRRTQLA